MNSAILMIILLLPLITILISVVSGIILAISLYGFRYKKLLGRVVRIIKRVENRL